MSGKQKNALDWIPWKTGIAFAHRGRTLLVVKQEINQSLDATLGPNLHTQLNWLEGLYRIEVHIYTREWVVLASELLECQQITYSLDNPSCLPSLATRLLVIISQHVKSLASKWFPGMLVASSNHHTELSTYMPCWKCFAEIGLVRGGNPVHLPGIYIARNQNPIHCFIFEESIVPAAQDKDLECPIHGKIKVVHLAPDLVRS